MDKVTNKNFGVYNIKGRADAVAKVSALVTYRILELVAKLCDGINTPSS